MTPKNEKVSFVLVNDEQMKAVNKQAFDKEGSTDVISFPMNEPYDLNGNYVGEVVVSQETVAHNAKKYDVEYSVELARVITHGVLHLLGYEDSTEDGRERMKAIEDMVIRDFEK